MKGIFKAKSFRVFGDDEERPLCLDLLSAKMAEQASLVRERISPLPGENESHENRETPE